MGTVWGQGNGQWDWQGTTKRRRSSRRVGSSWGWTCFKRRGRWGTGDQGQGVGAKGIAGNHQKGEGQEEGAEQRGAEVFMEWGGLPLLS